MAGFSSGAVRAQSKLPASPWPFYVVLGRERPHPSWPSLSKCQLGGQRFPSRIQLPAHRGLPEAEQQPGPNWSLARLPHSFPCLDDDSGWVCLLPSVGSHYGAPTRRRPLGSHWNHRRRERQSKQQRAGNGF